MASWDYIDTFFTDHLDSSAPRSNYSDPQPVLSSIPPPTSAPLQPPPLEPYHSSDSYVPQEPPRELPPPPQPISVSHPQQHPPPSPRKSMFEFISPFDALATNPTTVKKKPAPASTSSGNEDSWTSASLGSLNDPKRKSVENLIDQLTRGQAPYPSAQPPSPAYDPFSTTDEYSQVDLNQSNPQQSQQQSRPMPPPPLPPKPGRVSPPRASPPKPPVQHQPQRQQGRSTESPVGQPIAPVRRDKEGSPGPRSTWKNDGRSKPVNKAKSQSSPRCEHLSFSYTFQSHSRAACSHKRSCLTSLSLSTKYRHPGMRSSRLPSPSSSKTPSSCPGVRSARPTGLPTP